MDRQHLAAGARSGRTVLFREHDHHQRRFPADLCPLYLCGAERPCAGHPPGADHPSGVHADHRGQPWQYAHAHRQPTEPLPLRQERNEHGGVPPAHVPLHGRFAAASGGLGGRGLPQTGILPHRCAPGAAEHHRRPENHPAGCGAVCGLSAGGRPGIALRRCLCRCAGLYPLR